MSEPSREDYFGFKLKLLLGLLVAALGLIGFALEWKAAGGGSEEFWPDEIFYRTVQLYILESGAGTNNLAIMAARILAALLFLLVAYAAFRKIFEESWVGLRLRAAKDHDVLCGLGAAGAVLARQIQRDRKASFWVFWRLFRLRPTVVAIEADADAHAVADVRALGGVVIVGDATDEATLARARASEAARIFVATGSDDANVEIAFDLIESLAASPRRRSAPLKCYVHMSDAGGFSVFSEPVIRTARERKLELRLFSAARDSAAELAVKDLARRRPAPVGNERDSLFVLLGFGPLGQAAAVEIAQLAHYERTRRPAFVIATPDSEVAADRFLADYPGFARRKVQAWRDVSLTALLGPDGERCDWADPEQRGSRQTPPHGRGDETRAAGVDWAAVATFVEAPHRPGDPAFLDMLQGMIGDPAVLPSIVICLPEGREGFDAAMQFSRKLAPIVQRQVATYVWLPRQTGFAAYLSRENEELRTKAWINVPFGDCRGSASVRYVTNSRIERLAKRLHENYRRREPESSEGKSTVPWSELAPTFRKSNADAARHALIKLEVAGLELVWKKDAEGRTIVRKPDDELRETLARMEHARWMAERLLDGWRYGPKDDMRLTRPTLVPWDELDEDDRRKDRQQVDAIFETFNEGTTRIVEKRSSNGRSKADDAAREAG